VTVQGHFHNHLLPAYSRRQDALETTIIQLYSKGVTTREIADLIEKMYGSYYSPTTVSNITAQVTKQIEAFHQRTIKANYVCLILRCNLLTFAPRFSSKRSGLYCFRYYICLASKKFLIIESLQVKMQEFGQKWQKILKSVGLEQVQLIIADGMVGLQSALIARFP
jgi:transposase-like protein